MHFSFSIPAIDHERAAGARANGREAQLEWPEALRASGARLA